MAQMEKQLPQIEDESVPPTPAAEHPKFSIPLFSLQVVLQVAALLKLLRRT